MEFDEDKSGTIDSVELVKLMVDICEKAEFEIPSQTDLEKVIKELDVSRDNKIQKSDLAALIVHTLMNRRKAIH